jgi:hypothetical protein
MAVDFWTIRPRLAPRLCHRQATKLEWSRITTARRGQVSNIMVRPPPVHPDRFEWGSIRRQVSWLAAFWLLAFPGHFAPSGVVSNLTAYSCGGSFGLAGNACAPNSLLSPLRGPSAPIV